MHITLLLASPNEPSNSATLADAFMQGMESAGPLTLERFKLHHLRVDYFTLDNYDPHCNQEEDFCKVQAAVEKSDALVIATPIWNFGVPARLKNLIDRFGSFALDESRSKGTLGGLPFYIIFTGGAPYPAWKGLMQATSSHLPEALKYFGASYIGHHFEGKCVNGPGQFGLVVDSRPDSLKNVREKGAEFAKTVQSYKETGRPPVKHQLQGKIMRMGEKIMKKIF